MSWRWDSPQTSGAADTTSIAQEFPTQADAEAWLTHNYEELLDSGLSEVTLLHDDQVVYGPMSLRD